MTFVCSFVYMRGLMLLCLMKCLAICLLFGIFLLYMMLDICLNYIPDDGTIWGENKFVGQWIEWYFYVWAADGIGERMWPGKKKIWKSKFARIEKYKYVTGRLAFLIMGGRTAGLIYGRSYVSQVPKSLGRLLVVVPALFASSRTKI